MYKVSKNFMYRLINDKLVLLNLLDSEEILVFNDSAKEIFISAIKNDSSVKEDNFVKELLEKGIINKVVKWEMI